MQQSFKIEEKKSFYNMEKKILQLWNKLQIEQNFYNINNNNINKSNTYTIYDGPPFATGLPHYGHFATYIIKDVVLRYWFMNNKYINQQFGWDTHGLPIEMATEKKLNLSGPNHIKQYGIHKFNEACRNNVLYYTKEWKKYLQMIGKWTDFNNTYQTMNKSFMESVWWAFGELWKKKLIYKSLKVMPYSYRLSTPLSNFEANLNYKNIQDPAIIVKFSIKHNNQNTKLLIWTTTPWTLPANLAIAVHPEFTYIKALYNNEIYIISKQKAQTILNNNIKIIEEFKGKTLLNKQYTPLFTYFNKHHNAFKIVLSKHINNDTGTGLVHLAPAFGIDDFNICKQNNINIVDPIDVEGNFTSQIKDFKNTNIHKANPKIIQILKTQNKIFQHKTIQHSYPFCWRSGYPLIYKAVSVWMLKVNTLKKNIILNNKNINWIPHSIGEKRFGHWLENAQDWNISRNRFWGTPIPIWICKQCHHQTCISSIQELQKHTQKKIIDLHSHYINFIKIRCIKCHDIMERTSEIFDCWFDSGSMFFAKLHYPFENQKLFKHSFPAQFINEGLDQTRGWFYTMLVLSTGLFNKHPFENAIVNGLVLDKHHVKMSKSNNNFPDPKVIIKKYGADALRAYLINSPLTQGDTLIFSETGIKQIMRDIIIPLYNTWIFFIQYANIDSWYPTNSYVNNNSFKDTSILDIWIISRLESLIKHINQNFKNYHLHKTIPKIIEFIDDLTNWYIRNSRRRFWKNIHNKHNIQDKYLAYNTLYEVLTKLCYILAPFLPFITETIYQNLIINPQASDIKSIHLCKYPKYNKDKINNKLEKDINIIRQIIHIGRSLREKYKIKLKQPLLYMTIQINNNHYDNTHTILKYKKLIINELNIKNIIIKKNNHSLCTYILKPNFKLLGKKMGKYITITKKIISKFNDKKINLLQNNYIINLFGQDISLKDIIITYKAKKNMILDASTNFIIILNTHITKDLIYEGIQREFISHIQKLRKNQKLHIINTINIYIYTNSKTIVNVLKQFKTYISNEVLAKNIYILNLTENIKGKIFNINNQYFKVLIKPN